MDIDCPNFETCGGVLNFRVYQDSDGDGVRTSSWTDAECITMTCECDLDTDTWMRLTSEVIDACGNDE